jgi:peroxiredoxin
LTAPVTSGISASLMSRSHRWFQVLVTASVAAAPLHAQSPGDTAPAFSLTTLEGDPASLSDFAGRPVLINFWASWCKPCSGEMPLIIAAYRAHQQAGLAVLAIDLTDQEASTKDIRKFQAEFQMPFPVLLDKKGKARKLYRLRGVPTSVFVGSDGVIRSVNPGPISEAALQQRLAEIMP